MACFNNVTKQKIKILSQIRHNRGQVVVGAIACTNNITQQKFKPIVTMGMYNNKKNDGRQKKCSKT
jgi:hypothetical protein